MPDERKTRVPLLRTVRGRVMLALVLMTTLSLTLISAIDFLVDRAAKFDEIDGSLERTYAEVQELTINGVDPETGEPFANSEALVKLALQRAVAAPLEGFLGVVDGQAQWAAPAAVRLRLETDEELVAQVLDVVDSNTEAVRSTIRTETTTYRVLVIPVAVGEGPTGAVVVAFDSATAQSALITQHLWRLLIGTLVLLATAAVTWLFLGGILQPLAIARRTAHEITGSDLSQRIPTTGNDDLARLIGTLNGMLDRLETAFADQRQLLDDVSHELRTPLTIVQGHLELMDPADPLDARETRALVLDELERMNRLVEDLIVLAKASRPDYVRPAPVAIGPMLDRVMAKVRPLGDRQWTIETTTASTVLIDEQRVTQALIQLAGNAVKHTQPGNTIALGASVDKITGRVRIWVRDEGNGIPADQQQRIFERFAQVGQTGQTDSSSVPLIGMGLGLGLSIVASIARGHGGAVELDSRLGVGSRFTLVFPDAVADDAG